MPKIVNLREHPQPPYLYCGPYLGAKKPFRGTPLDEPDSIERLPVLRKWIFDQIKANNTELLDCLKMLADDAMTLACWCVSLDGEAIFTEPEKCRAQVLLKAARYLKSLPST